MLKLYDYFRSSASYRVRIVLNIKQIPHELIEVHLVNDGGEQHHAAYTAVNPQALVPSLVDGDLKLNQSLAIIDYLEKNYPKPSILPGDTVQQAQILSAAQLIACDIHPLDNLRVLQYLTGELGINEQQKLTWYHHWISLGFQALEAQIPSTGPYCFGETISLADVCLIPQVYNAKRFDIDMTQFPRLNAINDACLMLDAFKQAAP